jgi:MoaA/NifB/PqqE/SkfB family radical SAM enzyme
MDYTEIAPPPGKLVLETVSVCNLRCPVCRLGAGQIDRANDAKQPFMSMDLFEKICSECSPFVKHTYLHLWGEPTMHPKLGEMIKRVKQFSTIDLATHGMFITEKMAEEIALCDTISVSIDGIGQDVYEKYRVRGDYDKAMRGMKLLAKAAPGRVNWTWVLFSFNEHQIDEARKIASEIGVNVGFKPPYLLDERSQKEMLPKGTEYLRYTFDSEGTPVLKSNRYNCREFWETVYVVPNGDVVTCCYDFNNMIVCGNVMKDTLPDVWNGKVYQNLRTEHLARRLNKVCETLCKLPA